MLLNGRKAVATRGKVMPHLHCMASFTMVVVFHEEAWLPRHVFIDGAWRAAVWPGRAQCLHLSISGKQSLHFTDLIKKERLIFFFAMPSILTWFFLNNINKAENWKHITPLNQRESERGKIKHWTTRQPQCSSVCLIALIKHLNVQCFRLSKVKFPEMPPKSTLTPLTTQKLFSFVKKSILKFPESWKDLLWLLFTCVSVGSGQPWDHTAPHRRVGVCGGGALGSGLGSPWAGQHRRTARPWCRIIRNCYIKTL